MNIENADYLKYLSTLEEASGKTISSFADLKQALLIRMDYFNLMGCKVSDHGLNFVCYYPAEEEEIERIFSKRLSQKEISHLEELQFKTAFLLFVGRQYHKRFANNPRLDKEVICSNIPIL